MVNTPPQDWSDINIHRSSSVSLQGEDQQILDSFRLQYESRCEQEAGEVKAITNDPAAKVAAVVYSTG